MKRLLGSILLLVLAAAALWVFRPWSDGEFMALGGYGQIIRIDLKRQAVIAQTAARARDGGAPPLEQFKVFRAVVDEVDDTREP